MPLTEEAKPLTSVLAERRQGTPEDVYSKELKKAVKNDFFTAQDIKQSKDRINALRNSLPFYKNYRSESDADKEQLAVPTVPKPKKCPDADEEEKEKCELSDSESLHEALSLSESHLVHNRIACYELPRKGFSKNAHRDVTCEEHHRPLIASNEGYDPTEISRCKFQALKEKYQNSVSNLTYEGYDFDTKNENLRPRDSFEDTSLSDSFKSRLGNKFQTPNSNPSEENIIKIKSDIEKLESKSKDVPATANVIVGNKDILNLLSSKHLSNLNIRVERNPDFRRGCTDNRWKDNANSFRTGRPGCRTSLRSSARKRKCRYKGSNNNNNNHNNNIVPSLEEKGTSDSNLKENELNSDEELQVRLRGDSRESEKDTCENYARKNFPEYAKVNKRRVVASGCPSDVPSRSLSTSPIEKAPIVKKICSSGTRLKKDSEPSLSANPVKKSDSFRGSRVTRRNSFLYNTKGKCAKEVVDQDSFVKAQAVRLRRRCSKNSKKSEYRVSVTIRPSTVANLADKFNTIILQNQSDNSTTKNDFAVQKVSHTETKGPKYYSSPRASFKRKYRHKARAVKDTKGIERKCEAEAKESQAIDNAIYYSSNLSTRKSLNNSLSELNMKDLFEDCDYNKTDEEKVCEKLKTALSSGKFKGETDDSEDDVGPKTPTVNDGCDTKGFSLLTNEVAIDTMLTDKVVMDTMPTDEVVMDTMPTDEVVMDTMPADDVVMDTKQTQIDAAAKEEKIKDNKSLSKTVKDNNVIESSNQSENESTDLETDDKLKEKHFKNDSIDSGISADDTKIQDACAPKVESKMDCDSREEINHTTPSKESLNLVSSDNDPIEVVCAEETCLFVDNLTYDKSDPIGTLNATSEAMSPPLEISKKSQEVELRIDKKNSDDLQSDCSSFIDDSYSEVSSICSDLKSKKSKGESRIYTSLKAVVKNTVRKTKERDSERNDSESSSQRNFEGREKKKWYKRGKSRDRKAEKLPEEAIKDVSKEKKTKEGGGRLYEKKKEGGRLYEKWTFRRFRDKSEDIEKTKETSEKEKTKSKKEMTKGRLLDDTEDGDSSLGVDDQETTSESEAPNEELYGAVQFASRSRSREKRMAKEKRGYIKKMSIPENIPENVAESTGSDVSEKPSKPESIPEGTSDQRNSKSEERESEEEPKNDLNSDTTTKAGSDCDPEDKVRKGSLSIYEPHSPTGVKVIPPPPKAPIPSPPKQFKKFLFKHMTKAGRKESDKNCSDKNSDNADNIYENICTPDVQVLKKNRKRLEEEGIKPISSFLWSESAIHSASLAKSKTAADDTTLDIIYGDCFITRCHPGADNKLTLSDSDDHSVRYDKIGSGSDDQSVRYDRIGSPGTTKKSSDDSNSEGHNYTEIQNNMSGDSQTIPYDEIGAQSAVSYDEIAAPSSCGYDDVQAPPIPREEFDPFKSVLEGYDPVNPPKSDSSNYDDCEGGAVSPHLEIVRHINAHLYAYDDVSNYNVSQSSHSYEPVCPPDASGTVPASSSGNMALVGKALAGDSEKETVTEELVYGSDSSGSGPHEVFSYKLTRIGAPTKEEKSPGVTSSEPEKRKSSPGTDKDDSISQYSLTKETLAKVGKRKSLANVRRRDRNDGKDMWEDVSDSEEECDIPLTLTTKFPIMRKDLRARRVPRYRMTKKSWTQGIRDVAATHGGRVHAHSISSSLAKVNPHAHGKAKITPTKCQPGNGRSTSTDQVVACSWKQKLDSENECSPGHYEAIYEVINPAEEEDIEAPPVTEEDLKGDPKEDEVKDDPQDDYALDYPDLDDSFDSDDSDEAYSRLRPQFPGPKTLPLRHGSASSNTLPAGLSLDDKYLLHKYNRSQSHQAPGINRIAEAANLGMKRLRRNWSLTKNEVRTGLNRIKKKSTLTMTDMKGTEDILTDVSATASDKGKWSLKSRFRRKTSSGSSHIPSAVAADESHQRDNATFYLTLTLASNAQDAEEGAQGATPSSTKERRHSITPSVSSVTTTTSCETTTSAKYSSRPLSAPAASLLRNSSSGSNSGALYRPVNPPPAPPSGSTPAEMEEEEEEVDISKDTLASRLNQLLSSGPVAPPGRRILRTSESCSSSDVSPVPLLPPTEDKTSLQRIPLPTLRGASSLRQLFPDGASTLNIPQTRSSVASSSSHGSSEGYIRPSDIASSPPPLPARPASSYPSLKRLSTSSLSQLQSMQPSLPSPRSMDGESKSYLDLTYDSNLTAEEPPYVSSHFADEPLYQFYTAKVERAALYQGDSSEDDYEVINDGSERVCTPKPSSRPTAMELVTPTDGRRTLWCELPEVVSSGILNKISNQERKLQEAIFEVITSEASYLKSLEVLVTHFMNCEELCDEEDLVLSRRDKNVLFSDIASVKKCSELFLGDLEKRWQESFYISGITDIILKHATSSFTVYVKYCSNQIYQDRKLRDLKENNPRFVEVLTRLEASPVCQSLAMQSFLMLPMQRVTRLPLLIDAIFNRLEYGSSQWQECKIALASLQKIVAECNEAARKMERMEEMLIISQQLDFREVRAIPLISASRWLVKKGELTRLTWREGDAKLTFGRKISKHSLYFFLFTDLLVVTKKKSDDQYMVLDFCPRNMVQVLELESADKFPGRILDGHKNLIIMTMLQNHENKTVEMVLSCPLESDRSRWMEAVTPRISENPDERIYEEWDCPQVQAIHAYVAKQSDELSLEVSDVFNVLRKTSDGWYQGERLRDGARGWFPGNHTAEIASAHVRARNLRQRYRLLAISGSIVDELKKEKERYEKEEKKKDRRRTLTIKEVL